MTTFVLNSLTGRTTDEVRHVVLDDWFAAVLDAVPEFGVMRELSPAYHGIFSRPGATSDGAVAQDSAPAPPPARPQA